MPKREVAPFIFNIIIIESKCGLLSPGDINFMKITPIFGFTHIFNLNSIRKVAEEKMMMLRRWAVGPLGRP